MGLDDTDGRARSGSSGVVIATTWGRDRDAHFGARDERCAGFVGFQLYDGIGRSGQNQRILQGL